MTEMNFTLDEPTPEAGRARLGFGSIVLLAGVVLTVLVFGFALIQRNQMQPTSGPILIWLRMMARRCASLTYAAKSLSSIFGQAGAAPAVPKHQRCNRSRIATLMKMSS
jgi:hypothetical protein